MHKVEWARGTTDAESTSILRELVPQGETLHWSRIFEWPWVIREAALKPSDVVLKLGVGSSPLRFFLAKCAKESCEHRRRSGRPRRVRGAQSGAWAHQSPPSSRRSSFDSVYGANTFDKIICVSVLEHISDYQTCVDELWRVLKPGGVLLLD